MKTWIRAALLTLLPLGLFVALWLNGRTTPQQSASLKQAGTLTRHTGGTVPFASLQGHVRIVNFWATWCPPCVKEIPELLRVAKSMEAEGVVLLAVNADGSEQPKAFVDEFLLQHPSGLGQFVVYGDEPFLAQFRVTALPTTFVLDRAGQLVERFEGGLDESSLRAALVKASARP